MKGYTDNQSTESLLKKFMTSKFPSTLIFRELAEELTAKRCELKLQWLRRDDNQLADDLTNEKLDAFDMDSRISLKGEDMKRWILDKLMAAADSFLQELKARKGDKRAKPACFRASGKANLRRLAPYLKWIEISPGRGYRQR